MFVKRPHPKEQLKNNVLEMFIGPFGSSLKNDCFVSKNKGYCMVYEQKHAIQKTMNVETRYVSEAKFEELKRFSVKPGDLLVSCRGTLGEVYEIPHNAPMGIMHPSVMKIRLNKSKYNTTFFVNLLQRYMNEHLYATCGSSVKMGIKASELAKEEFIIPSMEEQNNFVKLVSLIDKSKLIIQKALEDLVGKV